MTYSNYIGKSFREKFQHFKILTFQYYIYVIFQKTVSDIHKHFALEFSDDKIK